MASSNAKAELDFDYFWFEERFRGDEAVIKERQRIYVDYFRAKNNALDLGCGRGEFLELLRENGISARGVDINTDMVLLCREKGLDVVQEDLFTYLESIPDESLDGIFAAQVIEHLDSSKILTLVRLLHRVLTEDGVCVVETVNPQCLTTFSGAFYADLTHVKPIHPLALQFIFESMNFHHCDIAFTTPHDETERLIPLPVSEIASTPSERAKLEDFNQRSLRLNDLLFSWKEYAVIARK